MARQQLCIIIIIIIVLANIYCRPSSSKSVFFEEFGLLLTNLGTDAVDRFMICGDFNLPGTSPRHDW